MKINKIFTYILKDFFITFGCVMLLVSIILGINSMEIIRTSILWQVILISSALTLFKNAYVNKFELGKKGHLINFTICSTLADIGIVLWLSLFSPGKINDNNLLVIYISIVLIVKVAVYTMMHIDGQNQAKQLNDKLNQLKNTTNE